MGPLPPNNIQIPLPGIRSPRWRLAPLPLQPVSLLLPDPPGSVLVSQRSFHMGSQSPASSSGAMTPQPPSRPAP